MKDHIFVIGVFVLLWFVLWADSVYQQRKKK